jgi:hypothetical protein
LDGGRADATKTTRLGRWKSAAEEPAAEAGNFARRLGVNRSTIGRYLRTCLVYRHRPGGGIAAYLVNVHFNLLEALSIHRARLLATCTG